MSSSEPIALPTKLAGKPARVLAFRVNRRPLGEGGFLPGQVPPDAFDHFARALAPGHEVHTSGRGRDRVWRVGGIEFDQDSELLTGKLGYNRADPELVPSWSSELNDWAETGRPPVETLVPFVFDGTTRLLGVVKDPSSAPDTVAAVFEMILRENEAEMADPSTEWSVEPLLDYTEFIEWLYSQDVVLRVGFTARLPNPEAKEAFEELTERLKRAHGTEYKTRMSSSREEGLQEIDKDPEFSQAIAMGQEGYAQLDGRGERDGKTTNFKQGKQAATEPVTRLPLTWDETRELLRNLVRERLTRFLGDDKDENEAA